MTLYLVSLFLAHSSSFDPSNPTLSRLLSSARVSAGRGEVERIAHVFGRFSDTSKVRKASSSRLLETHKITPLFSIEPSSP